MAPSNDPDKHSSSLLLTVIAVSSLLVIVGAATNPSAEEHRDRINKAVEARVFMELFGVGAFGTPRISYKDYTIASATSFGGDVLTIGVAGQVFLVGETKEMKREKPN
jgi:hypothetical protein